MPASHLLTRRKKEFKNQCLKSIQQSDKRNYGEQCYPFKTVTGKISCMQYPLIAAKNCLEFLRFQQVQ